MKDRKTGQLVKLWNRAPKYGWRNDGGPIPYKLRGRIRTERAGSRTVIIDCPYQRVPFGHWVVLGFGDELYGFDSQQVARLYFTKSPE